MTRKCHRTLVLVKVSLVPSYSVSSPSFQMADALPMCNVMPNIEKSSLRTRLGEGFAIPSITLIHLRSTRWWTHTLQIKMIFSYELKISWKLFGYKLTLNEAGSKWRWIELVNFLYKNSTCVLAFIFDSHAAHSTPQDYVRHLIFQVIKTLFSVFFNAWTIF